MVVRPRKRFSFASLALGLTLALSASVPAQSQAATAVSFQVSFGTAPQWVAVPNTQVYLVSQAERPDYDVFRYSDSYYAYNNDQWYRSDEPSGEFTVMANQSVPYELHQVPTSYWHSYPSAWQVSGSPAPNFSISIASSPQWVVVPNTRIYAISGGQQYGYDMFHYGHNYYIYRNNRWYRGRHWNGQFTLMSDRYVPAAFYTVPPTYWQTYPSTWQDPYGQYYQGSGNSYFQVSFGTAPQWVMAPNSQVAYVSLAQRPSYDVFRYSGSYYAYNNNQWYSSSQATGQFAVIATQSVPTPIREVPATNWRSYPTSWQNRTSPAPNPVPAQTQPRTTTGQSQPSRPPSTQTQPKNTSGQTQTQSQPSSPPTAQTQPKSGKGQGQSKPSSPPSAQTPPKSGDGQSQPSGKDSQSQPKGNSGQGSSKSNNGNNNSKSNTDKDNSSGDNGNGNSKDNSGQGQSGGGN